MTPVLPRSLVHVAVISVFALFYLLTLYRETIRYKGAVEYKRYWKTVDEKWTWELPPPTCKPQDAVWQPVSGTRYKFYVYSAYVERRKLGAAAAAVRIIAASKTTTHADPVVCKLWMPGNRTLMLIAKIQAIRENRDMKYSASYVLCLLHDVGIKPQETVGATISVVAVSKSKEPATNLLIILDTEPKKGTEKKLHVCVKPFHYSYDRRDWLIEWFELNRLLGVSHFYMYEESLSAPVSCLLEHYKKQGLVTLLSWKLPFVSKVEIRTEGLFAAFNDCLYRSMSNAGWLLVIDVDEVVLPRFGRTMTAFLTKLRAVYEPYPIKPAAFLFTNAFFYLMWEDDPEGNAALETARKTRRWTTPLTFTDRSKYAIQPRYVVELGNHLVWEFAPRYTVLGVPPEIALLHHYRIACELDDTSCLTVPSTIDRIAHRWSDELYQRVQAEKKQLVTDCPAQNFS